MHMYGLSIIILCDHPVCKCPTFTYRACKCPTFTYRVCKCAACRSDSFRVCVPGRFRGGTKPRYPGLMRWRVLGLGLWTWYHCYACTSSWIMWGEYELMQGVWVSSEYTRQWALARGRGCTCLLRGSVQLYLAVTVCTVCYCDILPHSSDTLPHSSDTLPHSSDTLPHSSDTLPHSSDILPHPWFTRCPPDDYCNIK